MPPHQEVSSGKGKKLSLPRRRAASMLQGGTRHKERISKRGPAVQPEPTQRSGLLTGTATMHKWSPEHPAGWRVPNPGSTETKPETKLMPEPSWNLHYNNTQDLSCLYVFCLSHFILSFFSCSRILNWKALLLFRYLMGSGGAGKSNTELYPITKLLQNLRRNWDKHMIYIHYSLACNDTLNGSAERHDNSTSLELLFDVLFNLMTQQRKCLVQGTCAEVHDLLVAPEILQEKHVQKTTLPSIFSTQ